MKKWKRLAVMAVVVVASLGISQQAEANQAITNVYVNAINQIRNSTVSYINSVCNVAVQAINASPQAQKVQLLNIYTNNLTYWCNTQKNTINRYAGSAISILNIYNYPAGVAQVQAAQAAAIAQIDAACAAAIQKLCIAALGPPDIGISVNGQELTDGQVINVGPVPVNTTQTFNVVVRNDGGCPLTVTNFSLPPGATNVVNLPAPGQIPAGGQIAFSFDITSAVAGTFGGAWSVSSDDPDENPFDGTLNVTFFVPGPEINVQVNGASVPDGVTANIGGQPFALPGHNVNLTIQNTGAANLNVTAIGFSNQVNAVLTAPGFVPQVIVPGGSVNVNVLITGGGPGAASGTVNITNDDADENTYDITLSTSFFQPTPTIQVDFAAGSGDFGTAVNNAPSGGTVGSYVNVTAGQAGLIVMTVTNTGTADLSLPAAPTFANGTLVEILPPIYPVTLTPGQSIQIFLQPVAEAFALQTDTVTLFNTSTNAPVYTSTINFVDF